MDKTFTYILIATCLCTAILVTKTSDAREYRNTFCRIVLKSVITLMWICIIALTTLVILY